MAPFEPPMVLRSGEGTVKPPIASTASQSPMRAPSPHVWNVWAKWADVSAPGASFARQLLLVSTLTAFAAVWTHFVVLPGKRQIRPIGRMPWYNTLVLAIPSLAALAATPLVWDANTQPFWVYLCAGVFMWWSSHKILAACILRGPLMRTSTVGQTALVLLTPAAFTYSDPAALIEEEEEEGSSTGLAARATSLHVINESPGLLLGRSLLKLVVSMVLILILALESQKQWSPYLRFALLDMVIYTFFSLVMDGPAALLRLLPFGQGLALVPHFDEPWLSVSFRDFWNNRWNLSAGRILRELVYEPILESLSGRSVMSRRSNAESALQVPQSVSSTHQRAGSLTEAGPKKAHAPSAQHRRRPVEHGSESSQLAGQSSAEQGPGQRMQSRDKSPAAALDRIAMSGQHVLPLNVCRSAAALATFLVSGVMHEVIMLYTSIGVPVQQPWTKAQAYAWPAPAYPNVAGSMMAFFLASGILCIVEAAVHSAISSRPRLQAALRAFALSIDETGLAPIRPHVVRLTRRLTVMSVQIALAHAYWWSAFQGTGLDVRLMREWIGWLAMLSMHLPPPSIDGGTVSLLQL